MGLLEEGDEIAADFKGSPAINAALISAAQKVEHYEMASYGCLHEWAGLLGNEQAARLLKEILDEEKAANEALTELARSSSNAEALCDATQQECADGITDKRLTNLRRGIRPAGLGRKRAGSLVAQ